MDFCRRELPGRQQCFKDEFSTPNVRWREDWGRIQRETQPLHNLFSLEGHGCNDFDFAVMDSANKWAHASAPRENLKWSCPEEPLSYLDSETPPGTSFGMFTTNISEKCMSVHVCVSTRVRVRVWHSFQEQTRPMIFRETCSLWAGVQWPYEHFTKDLRSWIWPVWEGLLFPDLGTTQLKSWTPCILERNPEASFLQGAGQDCSVTLTRDDKYGEPCLRKTSAPPEGVIQKQWLQKDAGLSSPQTASLPPRSDGLPKLGELPASSRKKRPVHWTPGSMGAFPPAPPH